MKSPARSARSFKAEVLPALVLEAAILVLASMVLDGGGIARVCLQALVGFWGAVGVLRIRRRGALSGLDVLVIRYGYIPAGIISFFVTRWIWHMRGFGHHL